MADKKPGYFDEFIERFKSFVNTTDPRTLLYSDERVRSAQEALKNPSHYTEEEINFSKKLVNAAVHPVTNDIIPKPFRVSAISPVNIPIVFAMLSVPATNIPGTLFLHFVNQSYNTACNYANRSGANQPLSDILVAYSLAVSSACGLAYGMGKFIEKNGKNPVVRRLGILVPLVATAAANISNIVFTRMDEIKNGAILKDQYGDIHGKSSTAGITCISQTALTRCVLVPVSCLLFPPVIMAALTSLRIAPASSTSKLRTALNLGSIYLSLQAGLPAALAVYPQTAKFDVKDLEPKYHNLYDRYGQPITTLYANKGL